MDQSRSTPQVRRDESPVCVMVALGASAGGVNALREFFVALRPCTGMTLVVVQHLNPRRQSLLPEILCRWCDCPVTLITEDMKIECNHVYVAPPASTVALEHHVFKLSPIVSLAQRLTRIDTFFSAVAKVFGARAVGIVLSGSGRDGSTGIRAISEAKGLTMAQEPETAQHPSMPFNAIQTGAVHMVLSPAQMAAELVSRFGADDQGGTHDGVPAVSTG